MPWTTTVNSSVSVTFTGDGTPENLNTLLNAAISGGASITNPHNNSYKSLALLTFNVGTSGSVLHWGNTQLLIDNVANVARRLMINCDLDATGYNAAGTFVGFGGFFSTSAINHGFVDPGFNVANTVTADFENFAFQWLYTGTSNRDMLFLDYLNTNLNTSLRRCTISGAFGNLTQNSVFYVPSGDVEDCVWARIPSVELLPGAKITAPTFIECGRLKNTLTTYVERGLLNTLTSVTAVGNNAFFHIINCDLDANVAIGGTLSSKFATENEGATRGFLIKNIVEAAVTGKGSNTSSVALIDAAFSAKYLRTLDSNGAVSGGNTLGTDNTNNSERISVLVVQSSQLVVTANNIGNTPYIVVEYGKLPISGTIELNGLITDDSLILSAFSNDVTSANLATASAYTGIAFSPADINDVTVTISANRTKQELYDYLQTQKASVSNSGVTEGSVNLPMCWFPDYNKLSYDIQSGVVNATVVLEAELTGTQAFRISGNLTLDSSVDFSNLYATCEAIGTIEIDGNVSIPKVVFESGATLDNTSASAATVIVAHGQFDNITLESPTTGGGAITLLFQAPVSINGFPNGSTVSVSQSGIQLDLVNNQNSPYTYVSDSTQQDNFTFKVVAAGYQDFIVTIDRTETTSAIWTGIPLVSNDTIEYPYLKFFELMAGDAAFQRIVNSDFTLSQQLWVVPNWQAEWNVAVVADTPTSGEIAVWVGYLTSSGYNEISFNASTGEVS
jgi:hypothetical protein